MKITEIKVNHLVEPLGYALGTPVVSWKTEGEGAVKSASIFIRDDQVPPVVVYESGVRTDALGLGIAAEGLELKPRTRYYANVNLDTEDGMMVLGATEFETGKMEEAWQASWISPKKSTVSAILRKKFYVADPWRARLYICGLGIYECYINGQRVGDEFLAPGYHSYNFHLQTQTYDVDEYLVEGENEIKVTLGEGWFKGRLGFDGGFTDLYGDRLHLIAELYSGGDLVLKTDDTWEELPSGVTFANIYDGEVYDPARATGEVLGYAELSAPDKCGSLTDRYSLPVKKQCSLPVKEWIVTPKGDTVLDFGQNLTGWVEFNGQMVPAGLTVKLTAGEILQDDEFYRDNYRTAKAEFVYISDGAARRIRPHYTFFGFRYMKLEVFKGEERLDPDSFLTTKDFKAWHIRSDFAVTASFECGNDKVNRLYSNAVWGMQDNFLEVPTDCPQRDERLGWTGDAQAISETACQTFDMPVFYRKYLWDMRAEQASLDGSVPNVVPRIAKPFIGESGICPWADAGVIIPWNVYRFWGDRELLREMYPGMKMWVDFSRRREEAEGAPHLVKSGFHFADWLALDNPQPGPLGATDPLYIASAYYYRCAQILSEAAAILGYEEAAEYAVLASEILAAIRDKYFTDGIYNQRTQTGAALAIDFGLATDLEGQGRVLRELVAENAGHLNTGFVGTPILCPALTATGNAETAVDILLNEEYPGWLYCVNLGATTIWERWNSVLPDGHMNPEGMNSLNHYTYGSIVSWMYRYLAGIRETAPGYRTAVIAPSPDRRLGHVSVRLETASGTFESSWKYEGDKVSYEILVPAGVSADIILPGAEPVRVTGGRYAF